MAETALIRNIGGIVAEVTVKEQGRDDLTITSHPVERGAAISDHAFKNPATLTLQAGWSAAFLNPPSFGNTKSGILSDIGNAIGQFSAILSPLIGSKATASLSQAVDIAAAVSSGTSAQQLDALYSTASSIASKYGDSGISLALSAAFQIAKLNAKAPENHSEEGRQSLAALYDDLRSLQSSATLLTVQTGKRLYENMLIKSLQVDTDQQTENVLMVTITLQEVILVETFQSSMPPGANRSTPASTAGVATTGAKAVAPYAGPAPAN